jgi:RecA-family ATPase
MSVPEDVSELPNTDDAFSAVREQVLAWRPHLHRNFVELRDIQEIRHMADPPWLVEGIMPEGAFAALSGKPGVYKSFAALDLGFSIATGRPWAGRQVRSGRVIYNAAEGTGGLRRRLAAWENFHDIEVDNMKVVTSPVNFLDPAMTTALIEAARQLPELPVLVVIDTLARSFGGGDENCTKDMNLFIAQVDRLRDSLGCAVLVVHHTPHHGNKLRGSSALPGALDTIISVEVA